MDKKILLLPDSVIKEYELLSTEAAARAKAAVERYVSSLERSTISHPEVREVSQSGRTVRIISEFCGHDLVAEC